MKTTVTVTTPSYLNPFLDRPAQRAFADVVRKFIIILGALIGAGIARRQSEYGHEVASLEYATDYAQAVVTSAAPANAATVTLNGTALTGGQKRASCTVTFASVADADTLTVNGLVFTAKTTPTAGNLYQFQRGGTDTADATAFIAALNAATANSSDAVTAAGVFGLIEGKNAAGVCTLYAITEGTAGNAFTIVTSNGTRLAITNDSAGSFANGAAAANNAFDRIGNDKRTTRSLINTLAASSSAIITDHVLMACRSVIVTAASVIAGDYVQLGSTRIYARTQVTDLTAGGVRDTAAPDDAFSLSSSDTNCAISICNCINTHPKLKERYYASNSSGAVTIQERPPEATEAPKIATSDGTRLAITGSLTAFADSALLLVQGKRPGLGGNAVTIATSSGSTLAITGSLSRLAGGAATVVTR